MFLLRKITITVDISIHALLAESDSRTKTVAAEVGDFYPRSPCGERPLETLAGAFLFPISIHALLAESDILLTMFIFCSMIFLSTLSLRRATSSGIKSPCKALISIHALLAESD